MLQKHTTPDNNGPCPCNPSFEDELVVEDEIIITIFKDDMVILREVIQKMIL